MKAIFRRFVDHHMGNAMRANTANTCAMTEPGADVRFMDLGCDDGRITRQIAEHIGTAHVFGVEYCETERTRAAKANGVDVRYADLNKEIPFDEGFFDAVHANQVIEHLHRPVRFMREVKRVLKPGGYAIISTENAASWHNIAALVLGWQMFSATCFSETAGCGNPMALWRGQENTSDTMGHLIIFTIPALVDLSRHMGFSVEKIAASGYYPLPYWVARIDKRHAHYITIKIRKQK